MPIVSHTRARHAWAKEGPRGELVDERAAHRPSHARPASHPPTACTLVNLVQQLFVRREAPPAASLPSSPSVQKSLARPPSTFLLAANISIPEPNLVRNAFHSPLSHQPNLHSTTFTTFSCYSTISNTVSFCKTTIIPPPLGCANNSIVQHHYPPLETLASAPAAGTIGSPEPRKPNCSHKIHCHHQFLIFNNPLQTITLSQPSTHPAEASD